MAHIVDKGNMTFRPSITVYQSKRRNVPEDEFPSFFFSHRVKFCETGLFDSFTWFSDNSCFWCSYWPTSWKISLQSLDFSAREGFPLRLRIHIGFRSHSISCPVDTGGVFRRWKEGEACS